jgi:adenylate cyclase
LKKKSVQKIIAFAIITMSVFVIGMVCTLLGGFDYLEYKTYDLRARVFAPSAKPSDDIIVVLLDQNSLDWGKSERGWGYPWPRAAWAEFVDYMNVSGAKSVAFDVLFTEPSVYGEKDDAEFARAGQDFGKVMQIAHFSTQTGSAHQWLQDVQKPLLQPDSFGSFIENFDLQKETAAAAQFPIANILNSAGALGSDVGIADSDGTIRRLNLFTLFDGKAIPGEAAASLLIGGSSKDITYNTRKKVIEWDGRSIPVDKDGKSLLRFRGENFDQYIPYPMYAILQSAVAYKNGATPEFPPEDFKDKYVFFGYYAPGLFDIVTTPISSVYPGMGCHITMLDNILQGDFTQETPFWVDIFLLFCVVALIGVLTIFPGQIRLSLGAAIVLAAVVVGAGFLAYTQGWWLPVVAPLVGIVLAYLSATLYNYTTEGTQKRFIKSAFSQYLSPTVIDQLLANPDQLKLGGERREISIFFSDIQGFSTISERLDPATLTEFLNDYLTFMTNIILDSGGTIDKYEGDAIIAFWNAPLSYPDHAARALGAAMECQRALAAQQSFYEEKYGARLLTRIGLNTGFAVVGNMGSNKHFNYTMLGDSVNLAARLEGLNKQFGIYLMCTDVTFNAANSNISTDHREFFGRKLASVAVVGKKEPATVYEPMAEALFNEKKPVLQKFDTARDLFYAGKFGEALAIFETLSAVDRPAYFYAEQCRYYLERPGEWKGFWQATTK